jgi:3-deoxy-D-arabino-heptulosonate 7-phosphate (DAHP) synthase
MQQGISKHIDFGKEDKADAIYGGMIVSSLFLLRPEKSAEKPLHFGVSLTKAITKSQLCVKI